MWDEKKFFSDFAKSSDSIKADGKFKEQLKTLPQMMERKKKVHIERYVLAVAALVLCVTLGTVGINRLSRDSDLKTPDVNAGAVNETETDLVSGGTMIVSDKYNHAVECLEDDNVIVTDAEGQELTDAEREALLKKVKHSVLITQETDKKYISYFCMEDKDLEIRVYEGTEDEISVFER